MIGRDPYRTRHAEEIAFLNALIIDLKLQCMEKDPRELVNMPRLEEATRIIAKLEQCKEQIRFY